MGTWFREKVVFDGGYIGFKKMLPLVHSVQQLKDSGLKISR